MWATIWVLKGPVTRGIKNELILDSLEMLKEGIITQEEFVRVCNEIKADDI